MTQKKHHLPSIHNFNLLLSDIPVDISAKDMKDRIEESTTKIGKVSVYRFGTCSGYEWEVFFETVGGDVKPFQVIAPAVTGNSASVTVVTLQDGGILYGPLTGEFLRLPKTSPQVSLQHKTKNYRFVYFLSDEFIAIYVNNKLKLIFI